MARNDLYLYGGAALVGIGLLSFAARKGGGDPDTTDPGGDGDGGGGGDPPQPGTKAWCDDNALYGFRWDPRLGCYMDAREARGIDQTIQYQDILPANDDDHSGGDGESVADLDARLVLGGHAFHWLTRRFSVELQLGYNDLWGFATTLTLEATPLWRGEPVWTPATAEIQSSQSGQGCRRATMYAVLPTAEGPFRMDGLRIRVVGGQNSGCHFFHYVKVVVG